MSVKYTRVNWQDAPSVDTPVNAANLNHMDNGILLLSKEYDTDVPLMKRQIFDLQSNLEEYVVQNAGRIVTEWLDEHVTPGGSTVVIDDTLAIQGAAADAKKTGDELSMLKEDFSDIIETVYSSNIFDQANFTVTEGKYLNPSSGNEGTNASYCYTNEYIPIEPNTQYIGSSWKKSDNTRVGYYAELTCYYNADKEFISGTTVPVANMGVFTTPDNAYYMRFSLGITPWNDRWYMIEKGNTNPSVFVPYSEHAKLALPITIVDINGEGDFTSIKDAVNALPDGSTLLVLPGTYLENVKAWSKEIHIIGTDRESCIIKDTSGNYSTPPIEIGAGSIQNMSIIEESNGAGSENLGAYAVHVESNNLYNKKLLIRNCYIYSDSSSSIGMGLRGGCSVRIEDCEIICAGARASTGAAPIYFHDADAQAYWGTANLYLKNNVLRNTSSSLFSMLTINSIHKENTTYMHVMYNIFVRSKTPSLTQKYNTWNTSGNTDKDGWNGLSHMYLEDDSFGNNQAELNYSA